MSTDQHLQDLQALVAEHAQTIEDLSAELYQQQKDIHQLKAEMTRLKTDLEKTQDTGQGYHNEPVKPPHY